MAGVGYAWRISEGQVDLVVQALGGLDRYLARSRVAVILKRCLAQVGLTLIVFHGAS